MTPRNENTVPPLETLTSVGREVARMHEGNAWRAAQARVTRRPRRTGAPRDAAIRSLLEGADQLARSAANADSRIGRMPPEPPTVRGKLGASVVRMVRRALFWYTQQVNEFELRNATLLRETAECLATLNDELARTRSLAEQLHAEQVAIRSELETISATLKRGPNRD